MLGAAALWLLTPCGLAAPTPFSLTVSPPPGSTLVAGETATFTVDTDAPVDWMKVKVVGNVFDFFPFMESSASGRPPVNVSMKIPWHLTGKFSIGIEAISIDNRYQAMLDEYEYVGAPSPGDVPTRIWEHNGWASVVAGVNEGERRTAQLNMRAEDWRGRIRDITLGATGTRYVSLNPEVAEVDQDGIITPTGYGETFVSVNHMGHTIYVPFSSDPHRGYRHEPVDVTGQVHVVRGPIRRISGTDEYVQQISVRNMSDLPLQYPVVAVLDGLKDVDSVDLKNRSGETRSVLPLGEHWKRLTVGLEEKYFPSGAVANAELRFYNPFQVPINYDVRVFSGTTP